MGFFDDLDLGGIISSVREMTTEITGLKDDLVSSVVDPITGLQDTVQDISGSLTGDTSDAGASTTVTDTTE